MGLQQRNTMNYISQGFSYQVGGETYLVRIGGDYDTRQFRAFIFSTTSTTVTILETYSGVLAAHHASMQFLTEVGGSWFGNNC